MKKPNLATALLAGTSLLVLASAAYAQTAQPGADQNQAIEQVVVTGSRVATGMNSPIPVTVTSPEAILTALPNTVYQALTILPQLNNSQGVTANPGGGTQAQAQNTPNLRNLNINGVPRTLVLWDGHRVGPTNPQFLTVDELEIPQMLLQRVDVATGGVSAVYGSDAIAGVINFITDTHFNGIKVNAQYGVAQRAGLDRSSDVGIAGGTSFDGGRGHIEGSLEYFNDPGVLRDKQKYPWAQQLWTLQGNGGTVPYKLFNNSLTNQYTFGGLISNGPLANQQFKTNGVLSPFVHGTPTLSSTIEQGGDGAYTFVSSLKSALHSNQLFARGDYDITDNVHGYLQFAGTQNHYAYIQSQNTFNETYSATNAFLTPAQQAAAGGAGKTFKMNEEPLEFLPTTSEAFETQYMVYGGLNGTIFDNYKWEVVASHSYSQQHSVVDYNINSGNFYAAIDAVVNPANGQIVCAAALSNPSQYSNCVPLNLFGPSTASAAAVAYVGNSTEYFATTQMDDVSGSVSGAPISTWAGPVNMALSADWRNLSLRVRSNSHPTDHPPCSALPNDAVTNANCSPTSVLYLQGNQADTPRIAQSVTEVAYEFDAPLLMGAPLAEAINLNGAARYTDYSTSGSVWTWKVGVDWQVSDEIRLRATRSQDIRAPNVTELFAPNSLGLTTTTDWLLSQGGTNVQAFQIPRITKANPNLVPEIAQNMTGGVVYRPDWLPGSSFSVDAFDIKISNAIAQIQGDNQQVAQACNASGGSSPYCQLIQRPFPISNTTAANLMTAVFIQPINIALVQTYGADVEANYATQVWDRPLSLRLLGTYQPHLLQVTPGLSQTDLGGVQPTPAIRLTGFLTTSPIDNFTVSLTEKWRSDLGWNSTRSILVAEPRIASAYYTNINLAYDLDADEWGKTQLFFNVQNLFDKQPVVAATTGGAGNPGGGGNSGYTVGDDLLGRYFTVGLHYRY